MNYIYKIYTYVIGFINSILKYFLKHSGLILELTKREFFGRYLGSFIGGFWSLIQPVFLLSVYTIAFGIILKARWGFAGNTIDYAFILFAGLIIYNAFTETLNKSPMLILGNTNYVKKVVFPLEILPIVVVITSLINASISILIWVVGYWILVGFPPMTFIIFPIILISFTPLLLGFGWLFSALGVFVKDLTPITFLISHTLLFLTPIFYSIDAAPDIIQDFLVLNPLTYIVQQLRLILFYGELPYYKAIGIYFLLSSFFALICFLFFKKVKPYFGDLV